MTINLVEKLYPKLATAAWSSGQYAELLLIGSGFEAAFNYSLRTWFLMCDSGWGIVLAIK